MDEPRVQPDLLILVEDAIEPLKMIVTWPKVYFDYNGLEGSEDLRHLDADAEFAREWGRVSGIDVDHIEVWAPVLFENGLLLDTGEVSDTAKGYVVSRGLAFLQVSA